MLNAPQGALFPPSPGSASHVPSRLLWHYPGVESIHSENNQPITLSEEEGLLVKEIAEAMAAAIAGELQGLAGRLDHLDTGVHELDRKLERVLSFIDDHRPALARAMGLMDPAAKLRAAMTRKNKSG